MNYGKIRISTNPSGATLYVGGQGNKGTTPIDIVNVVPGIYNIVLSYPDVNSYNFDIVVIDSKMIHVEFDFISQEISEKHIDLTGSELIKIEAIEAPPGLTETPDKNFGAILDSLNDIKSLLGKLLYNSEQQNLTNKFDTGLQTLATAVVTVPQPEDVSATSYTRIAIWDVLERLSQEIYIINNGPGTIYVRKSNDGATFSSTEIPVFAGEKGTFNNLYELRIRADLAATRYRITEHESNLVINNFDDRVATAVHISATSITGPVGFTTLATYTVPTGYKAKVHGVRIRATIDQQATVPGFRLIIIAINSPTLGLFPMIGATVDNTHNAVGFTREVELGYAYTLLTGESIEIDINGDSSTGGQMEYFGSVEITQYFSYPT